MTLPKKFGGVKQGEKLTKDQLPKIAPTKIGAMMDSMLDEINSIPPYYIMYPGRDKSVALKESVLDPQYPRYTGKYTDRK